MKINLIVDYWKWREFGTKLDFLNFLGYIASSLTYPFTVVTNCSIVSRSGLAAGYEPFMPFYNNWFDIGKKWSPRNIELVHTDWILASIELNISSKIIFIIFLF